LGSNASSALFCFTACGFALFCFALRFITGPPFAGVHLKNERHYTPSNQEEKILAALRRGTPLPRN
jgi:hypothetical protein